MISSPSGRSDCDILFGHVCSGKGLPPRIRHNGNARAHAGTESLQISELARLEFIATTMRKLREGNLDEKAQQALFERFEDDVQRRYDLLFFSSLVSQEATRILAVSGRIAPIRTLDAIQLAFYNVCCEENTVFVCADHRLLTVAEKAGRATLNPLASRTT